MVSWEKDCSVLIEIARLGEFCLGVGFDKLNLQKFGSATIGVDKFFVENSSREVLPRL